MATGGGPEITALLAAWRDGEPGSLDRLMELAYPELRRIAHQQLGLRRQGSTRRSSFSPASIPARAASWNCATFAGLTLEEAAGVLDISVETAKRDWRMARAWLLAELTRENPAT